MRYLSPYELIEMHHVLLATFGGMPGITEAGFARLETAAFAPRQSMFGADLYPDVLEKAAALFASIIANHSFSDGNKRLAVVALDIWLGLNGAELIASNDEMYDLAVATAERLDREQLVGRLRTLIRFPASAQVAKP
jgi:death on curing protein